ncbi:MULTISPECIES: hypothetical protein [unclassified Streptomyces]|nr:MULTISPECIES: hypothetical protein [unclassified Streptomyces]MCZ7417284.1 hypothetical protein [Streptomyces sp. WMMC897]MCZ7432889.1 hypothetical protein [Streptomyces sp. WMMC1477]
MLALMVLAGAAILLRAERSLPAQVLTMPRAPATAPPPQKAAR